MSRTAATPRDWREELRIGASARLLSVLLRGLGLTYRVRSLPRLHAERRRAGEAVRCIYAFWHETGWHGMLPLRGAGISVVSSESRDSEIAARLLTRLGYGLVKGSSTRGGARAMLEILRFAREGHGDLAVLVDGPTGPARVIKEGVLYAASRTGLPVVPVGFHVDRAWRVGSWDRHVIGKPFARVAFAFGPELRVPADAGRGELAGLWRERLVDAMDAAEAQARVLLGSPA